MLGDPSCYIQGDSNICFKPARHSTNNLLSELIAINSSRTCYNFFSFLAPYLSLSEVKRKIFSAMYKCQGTTQQGLANYDPQPNIACLLFLYDLQAKNYFYIFEWLKQNIKRRIIFCDMKII